MPLSKEEFEAKKAARSARFGAAAGGSGGSGKAELTEEQKKKLEERAKRWGAAGGSMHPETLARTCRLAAWLAMCVCNAMWQCAFLSPSAQHVPIPIVLL